MEFREIDHRLGEIHQKLLEARDTAQAGLELLNKLTIDLLRENALRQEKEEHDGGSDPIQR